MTTKKEIRIAELMQLRIDLTERRNKMDEELIRLDKTIKDLSDGD